MSGLAVYGLAVAVCGLAVAVCNLAMGQMLKAALAVSLCQLLPLSDRKEGGVPTHTTRLPVEVSRPLSVRVLPPQETLKAADIGVAVPRLGVCIGDGRCCIGVSSEPAARQTCGGIEYLELGNTMLRSPQRCAGVSFEPAPHLKPPVTQPRGSASVLLQGFHCSGSPSSLGLPFAMSPVEETEAGTVGIWGCRGDGMLSPTCWPAAEGGVAPPASAVEVEAAGYCWHGPYLTSVSEQASIRNHSGDCTVDELCQ